MNRKPLTKRKKGFVILTTGVMLTFIVPLIGLAIDAGMLYAVKARLQGAADAAALAAARSLAVGMTMAEQEDAARARGLAFFAANYPTNLFNTTTNSLTVDVAETGFRTRTVTITASVNAPLFFMRMLVNTPTTVVSTVGKASRRDVNVILVLDRSGSMNSNGGCAAMRNAANGFIGLFANTRDRMGMVTFGISYAISYAPNLNFKSSSPTLSGVINTITCSGGTGGAQGLFKGYEQIVNINEPGALNVIIFFTDGVPNTVTANFPVNVLDNTRAADVNLPSSYTNKRNSKCSDWQHGDRRWTQLATDTAPNNVVGTQHPNWNPNTEVFRGAIYSQEGLASGNTLTGIEPFVSSGFSDPGGVVSRPYTSSSPSATQYTGGNTQDCWFQGGRGYDTTGEGTGSGHVQYDIAYYPATDLYGTDLRSSDNFVSVTLFPSTYIVPAYANQIDVRDKTNMMNAAIAAVDNVGKRIRLNALAATINTVVYTIGLGETQLNQQTLLKRIANDATSPIYDSTKLEGLFVYAPTAADLNDAFVRIASEILRYAQ